MDAGLYLLQTLFNGFLLCLAILACFVGLGWVLENRRATRIATWVVIVVCAVLAMLFVGFLFEGLMMLGRDVAAGGPTKATMEELTK